MLFEELKHEKKIEALIESAEYLAREFGTKLFVSSDVELMKSNSKLKVVCESFLLKGKMEGLSELAKEQILDEAIQYGIEYGYKE